MNLREKSLSKICEGDLQSLIENKVPESRYKSTRVSFPGELMRLKRSS